SEAAAALRYAYHKLATAQAYIGDLDDARDSYERGLKVAEALLARSDATIAERNAVQGIHQSFGDLLAAPDEPNLGDVPGGLAQYKASLAISEQFAAADPNDRNTRRVLASACRALGLLQLEHSPVEALALYRRALALNDELYQIDTENLELK